MRQKSTAQISRQTCVAQQNVQAVCKRVLVCFAICNRQSVKQPPTTHLFCCQARFFAICACATCFCRHTNSLLRVLHTKIFFLHCLGQGFNVNFAVCLQARLRFTHVFFAISAWATSFLYARKLTITSLAREKHFSALHRARFQRNFAVCRLVCVSRTFFFAISAWATSFLSAHKLTITSLAHEDIFSALPRARFQRKFCSLIFSALPRARFQRKFCSLQARLHFTSGVFHTLGR